VKASNALTMVGCAAVTCFMASAHAENPKFSKVTEQVDTNHDGKMSRAEWQAAGLPSSSFNMFEQGRGFVLQEDYENNPAPDGIDINGDGYLTVDEFVAFDKKMSANMPPGGLPPGGPQGGPPPAGQKN